MRFLTLFVFESPLKRARKQGFEGRGLARVSHGNVIGGSGRMDFTPDKITSLKSMKKDGTIVVKAAVNSQRPSDPL